MSGDPSNGSETKGLVVVRLLGGIGNQLFQYGAARALANARGCRLRLDVSSLHRDPLRDFALHGFRIEASVATPEDVLEAKGGAGATGALRRRLDRFKPYYRRHHWREPCLGFDPNLRRAPSKVYLDGYWQSDLYFRDIAAALRAEIVPRQPAAESVSELAEAARTTASVSLHVRRGDYVEDPKTASIYRTLGEDYYRAAVAQIRDLVDQPRFFLFSDDPRRAGDELSWLPEALHVSPQTSSPHEDLWLISRCRHHITANSSFSWWGAWLAGDRDKRVFAPRSWTNAGQFMNPDRYPESWTLL